MVDQSVFPDACSSNEASEILGERSGDDGEGVLAVIGEWEREWERDWEADDFGKLRMACCFRSSVE